MEASDRHFSYSHYLSHNVLVSVSYSQNPFYNNDTLKAIITFKHIDPNKVHNTAKEEEQDLTEESENNDISWSRRLSSQFSRSLFLNQLVEQEDVLINNNNLEYPEETFLSGNLQLFGYLSIDNEIVEIPDFQALQKKTIINGNIGGISSLKVSNIKENSNFLKNLSNNLSSFLNSDIDELNSKLLGGGINQTEGAGFNILPIISTNQLLLFADLKLNPGEFKQYYLNIKLPETLPSSYKSDNLMLTYNLILNVERIDENNLINNIELKFPLNILIAPNNKGYQIITDMSKEFVNNKKYLNLSKSSIVDLSNNQYYNNFNKLEKLINKNLNIIEEETVQEDEIKDLKNKFIETMETLLNHKSLTTSEQIKSLPNSPKIGNSEEESFSIDNILKNDGRNNLKFFLKKQNSQLLYNNFNLKNQVYAKIMKNSSKSQYFINYQKKFVTKLIFNKSYYQVGDIIRISFDFKNNNLETKKLNVTGISVVLESIEKFKYEYLKEYASTVKDIFDEFQNNPKLAYKNWNLPIPNDGNFKKLSLEEINDNESIFKKIQELNPNYWKKFKNIHSVKKYSLLSTNFKEFNVNDLFLNYSIIPQFKNSIMELSYYLNFKFILINNEENYLGKIKEENHEGLHLAKENLSGQSINIKIPIDIIGSEIDLGNNHFL